MLLISPPTPVRFHDSPALRHIERAYRLRQLTFGLGTLCVAGVLCARSTSAFVWMLLVGNALVWPVLARSLSLSSRDPRAAEIRNLLIDSALAGVWVALMRFNLLPCVLLSVVLASDKAAASGIGLLLRALLVELAACVLTVAVVGLHFAPQTGTAQILAAVPLLAAYPLTLALRLRAQMLGAAFSATAAAVPAEPVRLPLV
jgi:diguanylate cyclase